MFLFLCWSVSAVACRLSLDYMVNHTSQLFMPTDNSSARCLLWEFVELHLPYTSEAPAVLRGRLPEERPLPCVDALLSP